MREHISRFSIFIVNEKQNEDPQCGSQNARSPYHLGTFLSNHVVRITFI